jgi:predicted adenylyl cyclase CyaB
MPRNVEIKAKIASQTEFEQVKELLANLPNVVRPVEIQQQDFFYSCANGRLKLRVFNDGTGNLIQYTRADESGPKCSTYQIFETNNARSLHDVLQQALDTTCIVRKQRLLYLVGQTRVHLDCVEKLGFFVELEVVLNEKQTIEEGQAIAHDLAVKLHLTTLVSEAYADLLQAQKQTTLSAPSTPPT